MSPADPTLSNAGLGVVFTDIDPNCQFILEKWIAQLRDSKGRAPERAARFWRASCQTLGGESGVAKKCGAICMLESGQLLHE